MCARVESLAGLEREDMDTEEGAPDEVDEEGSGPEEIGEDT